MVSQEQHIPTIVSSIRQGGVGFYAAAICGLATYVMLLRRSYFAVMFHAAGFEGGFLEPYYALFLAAALILAVIGYFTASRIESRVNFGSMPVCLVPYLSIVGSILVFASTSSDKVAPFVLIIGVLVFALGATGLALFLTLSIVSRVASKRILGILVTLAYFLSTLLSLGSAVMPSALDPVFVIGCPLVSSLAWQYCKPADREGVSFDFLPVGRLRLNNALFLAGVYLICSVMLGCNFTVSLSSATTPVYFGTHGMLLVACFVLLVIIMFAVENGTSAFVLEIAGVFAFIALFFFSALLESEWVSLSANIVASARLCFELLLWIVVMCSAVSRNVSAFMAASCFLVLRVVSDLFVNLLVPQVISLSGGAATDMIHKVTLALFFVLSLAFVISKVVEFVSRGRSGDAVGNSEGGLPGASAAVGLLGSVEYGYLTGGPSEDGSSAGGLCESDFSAGEESRGFIVSCDNLAARHGLSKRESEILHYIARGYSSRWIAETLCISMSTVQSHSKSIYRKLDIHSKQELLELVNPAD